MPGQTLSKAERLCGKSAVEALFGHGKGGMRGCLRYRYTLRADENPSRILVSVPKRCFKRAVKRNLLKRRIREAYRRQKSLLGPGVDILFLYADKQLRPYAEIYSDMTAVLSSFSGECKVEPIDNQEESQKCLVEKG